MGRKFVLNHKHISILQAVKVLQPCGSTSVAKLVDMREDNAEKYINQTLYKNGYLESDTEVWHEQGFKRGKRIKGTIRLTDLGEAAIREHARLSKANSK